MLGAGGNASRPTLVSSLSPGVSRESVGFRNMGTFLWSIDWLTSDLCNRPRGEVKDVGGGGVCGGGLSVTDRTRSRLTGSSSTRSANAFYMQSM